ncbi:MAG: homocysteine S-methyltransferase family protein [Proteobacteria bacterium]|nr:homocysteine S-methyltransferase family protein [Pseudomonadota bacterium]
MAGRITLLDGGMGRELKRMGAPFRQPQWSALALMEAPDFVNKAHAAFIAAGAEVVTTNSYAVVPFHIGRDRFAADGRMLAERAGRLARAAADDGAGRKVLVAASLPPLFGSYRPDLFDAARAPELLRTLVEGLSPHADLWLAETLGSIAEAAAVNDALAGDARPLWISFTLADERPEPSDPRLRSGEPVAEAVRAAARLGAAAVLFNCSQPEVMAPALEVARDTLAELDAAIEIGAYANAFRPKDESAQANEEVSDLRTDLDPPRYLGFARDWMARGAAIVGGCCGIGPEHIAALRAELDRT